MNPEIDAIRACKYLYLHSISEAEGDVLRLVLHEAKVGGALDANTLAQEPLPEVRKLLAESKSIIHGPGCQVFALTWLGYIGYSVENESFALPEPAESIGDGRLAIVYTKSVYLEYLAKVTFASEDFPGLFKHWAIHCLDHIVNVASTEEPRIQVTVSV